MRPKSDSQWWERGLQGNATQQHSSSPNFFIQLLFIRQLWECLTFVNSSLSPSCCEWRCWRASQFLKARDGEEFNSESTTATLDLLIIFGTVLQDDAMLTLKYTDFNCMEAVFQSRNGRLDPSSHLERSYLIGVPKDNWGGAWKNRNDLSSSMLLHPITLPSVTWSWHCTEFLVAVWYPSNTNLGKWNWDN